MPKVSALCYFSYFVDLVGVLFMLLHFVFLLVFIVLDHVSDYWCLLWLRVKAIFSNLLNKMGLKGLLMSSFCLCFGSNLDNVSLALDRHHRCSRSI